MSVLSISRLSVTRGRLRVLSELSLEVREGERVGILGPSGAGKSTLFRAIAGEDEPEGGTIDLDGKSLLGLPLYQRARRGLGYIPQEPSVLFELTVEQNLLAFAELTKSDPVRAKTLGERVGLGARFSTQAKHLSAGERRRLEFARAVLPRPRLLLCDEPWSGIDPQGGERLAELVRELSSEGVTIVLADHHVAEALSACTRACLLLEGRITVDATPDEFRENALVKKRYLSHWESDGTTAERAV